MVSPCAGISSVEKVYMIFPKHQRFAGREIDALCFNISLLSDVETFTRQVLNEGLNMNGSAEMDVRVRTYVSAMDRIEARRKRVMWDAPVGLSAMESFPRYIVHCVSNRVKVQDVLEMGRHLKVTK